MTDLLARLVQSDRLNPLGPGTPSHALEAELRQLTPQELLAPYAVHDTVMAQACLAGLWLHHDFLEESHRISQDIDTPTGSYWHAIMHRREPDYWNSKYWFRRVGVHPVYAHLGDEAMRLGWSAWDPFAFVDLCARAATAGGELEEQCQRVQRTEWELLFDWCCRQAVCSPPAPSPLA